MCYFSSKDKTTKNNSDFDHGRRYKFKLLEVQTNYEISKRIIVTKQNSLRIFYPSSDKKNTNFPTKGDTFRSAGSDENLPLKVKNRLCVNYPIWTAGENAPCKRARALHYSFSVRVKHRALAIFQ